jgi:RNA 2',3'-cyclic 3'-phosphodiesterase
VATVGRVFAAVPIPVEIRIALADRVSYMILPGRVVAPEDWHITLRFLGQVESVVYERFLHGLGGLGAVEPFRLGLDGLGAFPSPRRATVVWAGVGPGAQDLETLNEVCEDSARAAGLQPEDRPFHPHLTLSRVRPPADVRSVVDEPFSARWVCDRVFVFGSRSGVGPGPRYQVLESFSLNGR